MGFDKVREAMAKRPALVAGPPCPACKTVMVERLVQKPGPRQGQKFWGCSDFPTCKGTMPYAVGLEILKATRKREADRVAEEKAAAVDAEHGDDLGFLALLDE